VKIPRVPVSDDSVAGTSPTYRDLWVRIRDGLPKKGRATDEIQGEPKLPKELEGALRSLYGNYEKSYQAWKAAGTGTPPVFIVVCQWPPMGPHSPLSQQRHGYRPASAPKRCCGERLRARRTPRQLAGARHRNGFADGRLLPF
jgi:hypothetical protein